MFSQANQYGTLQSGMLGRPPLPILDFLQLWPTETQLFPQLSNPWVSLNLVILLATKTGNLLNLTKDLTKFSFVQEIWYFETYIYFFTELVKNGLITVLALYQKHSFEVEIYYLTKLCVSRAIEKVIVVSATLTIPGPTVLSSGRRSCVLGK